MLAITASIFSAKGRAASAAVCARRSFEAATICMALVIFCVALVEAMRTRMSFSEAILSSPRRSDLRSDRKPLFRHARPCAGHPRLVFHPRPKTWVHRNSFPEFRPSIYFAQVGSTRLAVTSPAMTALSKRLGVALDHSLELGGGVVAEIAGVADGDEVIVVLAAQQRQQAVLEG